MHLNVYNTTKIQGKVKEGHLDHFLLTAVCEKFRSMKASTRDMFRVSYVCACACVYLSMYVCMQIQQYEGFYHRHVSCKLCMCMCVFMYVCMYVCNKFKSMKPSYESIYLRSALRK